MATQTMTWGWVSDVEATGLVANVDMPVLAQLPVWTARCKSGYQYETGKYTRWTGRPVYRVCRQVTGKGELMCQDCLSAEVEVSA